MDYTGVSRLEVYAYATRQLRRLEPNQRKLAKYLDFIDIYGALTEAERREYIQRYPEEATYMSAFAERFRQEGRLKGLQEGRQTGITEVLSDLLQTRFGTSALSDDIRRRLARADIATLQCWSQRVLTANSLREVLR